jgi:hypothetical protein
MAADRPTSNRRRNSEKVIGMVGSHTPKTSTKFLHHTAVHDIDTSRKEETREDTQHLVKRPRSRCEVDRTNMGQLEQTAKKQAALESSRQWPMLQEEVRVEVSE